MAAPFSYSHCQNLKTAIAERIQEIVAETERWLNDETESFVKARLPRGAFDPSTGPNPRKLRYGFAPAEEREYLPILSEGKVDGSMDGATCTGKNGSFDVEVDKTGAYGCDLPGQELEGGFDVFTYELKGKAFETGYVCALDLLLKQSYNAYLAGLQKALRKEAMRHHSWALERDVISLAKYNTSVTDGFTFSEGGYVAEPTGVMNVETVKRMFAVLKAEGWTGPMVVGGLSEESFERMRQNYRTQKGLDVQTNPSSLETEFLPKGARSIEWSGITWVFSDAPLRGYLRELGDGSKEFVPVRPTITRPGTGGGVVSEVNHPYYDCTYYCEGKQYTLFEVAFVIHPEFAKVLSFQMPTVAGKSWSGQLFNLDLRMVDGPTVTNRFGVQNTDNFKFFFRALHAYSFEPETPELAGTVLYQAAPYSPIAVANTCNSTLNPGVATLGIADAAPQEQDGTQGTGDPNAAECDTASFPVFPEPTQEDPRPTTTETGTIRWADCGEIIVTKGTTVRLFAERVDGFTGAASASADTVDGTAAAGDDFTAVVNAAVAWEAGEGGMVPVDVVIAADADSGQSFTVTLDTFVGAAEGDCSSVTLTIA